MTTPQVAPAVTPEADEHDMMAQYNEHLKEQADAYDTVQRGLPWVPPDAAQMAQLDELEDFAMTQHLAKKAAGG